MFNFVYLFFIYHYCSCVEDKDAYIEINDNAYEVDRLFYGDLTNINEMFLPPLDAQTDIESEEDKSNETRKQIDLNFEYLQPTKSGLDITEFNEITKILNNATRRWYGHYQGWNDPQDPKNYIFWIIPITGPSLEAFKKDKMVKINIQYLIHARYQVKKAILKKHIIRTDKRYRIGYLFNRLKRIKFEQQKIVSYVNEKMKFKFRDLTSQLKLYEKMVRYDVDITDTIKLIKEIDKETGKMILIPEMTRKP